MPASLREYFAVPGNLEVKKAVLVKSQQEQCLWLFPLQIGTTYSKYSAHASMNAKVGCSCTMWCLMWWW